MILYKCRKRENLLLIYRSICITTVAAIIIIIETALYQERITIIIKKNSNTHILTFFSRFTTAGVVFVVIVI